MKQQQMMETEWEMRERLVRRIESTNRVLDNDFNVSQLWEIGDDVLEVLGFAQLELLAEKLDLVLEAFEEASRAYDDVYVEVVGWYEDEE